MGMNLVNSMNVKTTLSHIIARNRQSTSRGDSKFIDGTWIRIKEEDLNSVVS